MNEEKLKEDWYNRNAPLGLDLGYPQCCVNEFCAQPPELLKGKPTREDIQRHDAGFLNNQFTGFIPCAKHSREIIAREITLESLIKNRSNEFGQFPNHNRFIELKPEK